MPSSGLDSNFEELLIDLGRQVSQNPISLGSSQLSAAGPSGPNAPQVEDFYYWESSYMNSRDSMASGSSIRENRPTSIRMADRVDEEEVIVQLVKGPVGTEWK